MKSAMTLYKSTVDFYLNSTIEEVNDFIEKDQSNDDVDVSMLKSILKSLKLIADFKGIENAAHNRDARKQMGLYFTHLNFAIWEYKFIQNRRKELCL